MEMLWVSRPGSEGAWLSRSPGGELEVGVADPDCSAIEALTDEQAYALELALYRHRIKKTFDNRKEPDADGLEGSRPELERGTGTPPHP